MGLASALGTTGVGRSAQLVVQAAAPGPVGDALSTAVAQARTTGSTGRVAALLFGAIGSLATATTGMSQLQRSLNRLYGIERDRPTGARYRRAVLLAVSAGTLIAAATLLLATGTALGRALADNPLTPVWGVARVPLAAALLVTAVALLFRWCPDRRQPGWSWLGPGAAVSVAAWVGATVLLGLLFRHSSTFGRAYGPLAGMVALMLWSLLSSIALLFGAAVAAELEGRRPHRTRAPADRRRSPRPLAPSPDGRAPVTGGAR